jgi:hypothetical protein
MARGLSVTVIFLSALWPLQGFAQLRDGVYDAYDCTAEVSDLRIAVRGRELAFYETACRLGEPEPVEGMEGAALYWADCTGEGETWRDRFLLKHHVSGALDVASSHWFERHRHCNNRPPQAETSLGSGNPPD